MITHSNGLMFFVGIVALASGFLLGSRVAPQPLNSELADAQVVAQNRDVRWIAYGCEGNSTIIARDMPDITQCREARRLSEVQSFAVPPRY
jgi:hypothetical protein